MRLDRPLGERLDEALRDEQGRRKDRRLEAAEDHRQLPRNEEHAEGRDDGQDRPPSHEAATRRGRGVAASSPSSSRIRLAVRETAASSIETSERGRGSSTGTTAATRPGRGVITTTSSATRIASGDAVGHEHDRRGRALPQRKELEVEPLARQRVERAERLVEQQHLRLERERPADGRALLLTAGQLRWPCRGRGRVEPDQVEQLAKTLVPTLARPPGELERVRDVRGRRPPRQQARLLEDQPDPWIGAGDRGAVEADLPAGRFEQSGDDAQERGLAAAVWPDQGNDATARDRQVDAVERLMGLARAGPEGEGDVMQVDGAAHRTSTSGCAEASGRRSGAVAG